MIKTALANVGFTGKLLVAWMPWTGDPTRVNHSTGYIQTTPSVIKAQVACIKAAGFDGVVAVWQGQTHTFTNQAFLAFVTACINAGLTVVTMLDPWIAKGQSNPTKAVITALSSQAFKNIIEASKLNYVLEFDLANSASVNVPAVRTAFPALNILSWHTGFSWPTPLNPGTTKADNVKSTCIFPCVYYQFFDGGYPLPNGVGSPGTFNGQRDYNTSVWGSSTGPTRILDPTAGSAFLDEVASIPKNAKYAMFATWNDWDEGTAIEGFCSMLTGIKIA